MGALRKNSEILEFDNSISPQTAAEKLLSRDPEIILFSVYIWNLVITYETLLIIKNIRPDIKVVVGGPEVSYEYEDSLTVQTADHLIRGEGETVIEQVCRTLLQQGRLEACGTVSQASSLPKVIDAPPADLNTVVLPYEEYTDEDIAHRRVYVESTRGCPFSCSYCLSSLETGIRKIPHERLFPIFDKLIGRGARIFKFIDRSFNACPNHAEKILAFFLNHQCNGMMLHLEWEPHLLPKNLLKILQKSPDGFFQLEAGVQTFTPDVAKRINRRLTTETVEKNIRLLSTLPSVHLHADLIAGLPGETLESLSESFDRLHACGPHEIQLGILKKLRGAPIAEHDREFGMVYNCAPPYDVLQTSTMSFPELQAVRRFARFWDITVNNGRFPNCAPFIWNNQPSVFTAFMEWSNWLYEQTHAVFGFTPTRLGRLMTRFLTEERNISLEEVSLRMKSDFNSKISIEKGMERQTRHQTRP